MLQHLCKRYLALISLGCFFVLIQTANAADRLAEERSVAFAAYEHKNYKLAYVLLNKLAKQGDVYANYNLAHLLEAGQGTEVDLERAIHHYKFAIENGVLDAANNLGAIYSEKMSGKESSELAVYYYRLAADKGNLNAQSNLAQYYLLGEKIEQDFSIAHKYFTMAALQDDMLSQYQLGVMYVNGDGVKQNIIEAYAWISLANQNGVSLAPSMLMKLKSLLDPASLQQARERAVSIRATIEKKRSKTP